MNFRDQDVSIKSSRLKGCRVAFGVSGGIGAVEVVKIIRELRRHMAFVSTFISASVPEFINPKVLDWACGGAQTGVNRELEHLDPFHVVVVAPATINTLNKMAAGIADNPLLLCLAAQLGARAPIICFPTMNVLLRRHPRYELTVSELKTWGVSIENIEEEEGRLKMPSPEQVFESVCRFYHEH